MSGSIRSLPVLDICLILWSILVCPLALMLPGFLQLSYCWDTEIISLLLCFRFRSLENGAEPTEALNHIWACAWVLLGEAQFGDSDTGARHNPTNHYRSEFACLSM
eukprot:4907712-Amphidinium_carterae.1